MADVKPIPEGHEAVVPYLICKNAEAAIDFYKRAFGADELIRMGEPGKVGHCEMKIGNARFMLADEFPDLGDARVPKPSAARPSASTFMSKISIALRTRRSLRD